LLILVKLAVCGIFTCETTPRRGRCDTEQAAKFIVGLVVWAISAVVGFVADHWTDLLIGLGVYFVVERFTKKIDSLEHKVLQLQRRFDETNGKHL
jgi:hypothetical protein